MSSFRQYRSTDSQDSEQQQPSNPFGNMRRDRQPRTGAVGMSYTDWKQSEKKKKEENRPLTEDDFPPLGGGSTKPVVTVRNPVQSTGETLASRIASAMKKEEDEAMRRRLQQEEEERVSKDNMVSLPITSINHNRIHKKKPTPSEYDLQVEEENYRWQVSSEIEPDVE